MILMTDEEYASYLNDVRSLSKKEQKKWKRQNDKTDGSISTIRFDGQNLYAQWLNRRVEVKSQSMIVDTIKERKREGYISKVQIEDFQDTGLCTPRWIRCSLTPIQATTPRETGRFECQHGQDSRCEVSCCPKSQKLPPT